MSKWKVTTINECIKKLKTLEKIGKKIIANKTKEMLENKRLGDRLRKLCIEEYIKTGKVSGYCNQMLSGNNGSGSTQTG